MNEVPSTLGGLLSWLASGAGIGFALVWLASLPFWATLGDNLKWVKPLALVVIGSVLGIGASLGTTYLPAGVVDAIEPFYKIVWTVVTIVVAMYAGQTIVFRVQIWKQHLTTRLGLEQKELRGVG